MITPSPSRLESQQWRRELADAITDPRELLAALRIEPSRVRGLDLAARSFALRVPRFFVSLMRQGDPADPLLAQVLPTQAEDLPQPGFVSDPVGDLAAAQQPGILHKYLGRALLLTTGACAVHCRYCFRRGFPYAAHSLLRHWDRAFDALQQMPDVNELILSGGDPLSLSDRRLAALISRAQDIRQLQRLRIHTRLPVVLPSRVTQSLIEVLGASRLHPVMVIHVNHPNEISDQLRQALSSLREAGVPLLNQSVLLKSVNDQADTLVRLSETLFAAGVLPYYLHLLDPVHGAAHYDVSLGQARALMEQLQRRLPGYLVPRMVRELPGTAYKTPIASL